MRLMLEDVKKEAADRKDGWRVVVRCGDVFEQTED